MRLKHHVLIIAVGFVASLSACGTSVDSGRNSQEAREGRISKEEQDSEITRNGETVVSRSSAQSCFGSSEVENLESLRNFCGSVLEEDREKFGKLFKLICEKKELSNLFLPECGWDGENGDPRSFLKVQEHTDLEDESSDFYYLGAYSLSVKKSELSFKDMLLLAHSDPEKFAKKYNFPVNTTVTPWAKGIVKDGIAEELEYRMEIKNSQSPTKFTSFMRGMRFNNGLEVVFDRALDGKNEGINMRRSVNISFDVDDEITKILVFEEREVPDHRLHPIAKKILEAHDLSRMKLFYENSIIR